MPTLGSRLSNPGIICWRLFSQPGALKNGQWLQNAGMQSANHPSTIGEASIFCWLRCQAFQNQHQSLIIHYSTKITITTIPEISCFSHPFLPHIFYQPIFPPIDSPPSGLPNSKVGQEVEAFWTQDHWWSASTACALKATRSGGWSCFFNNILLMNSIGEPKEPHGSKSRISHVTNH